MGKTWLTLLYSELEKDALALLSPTTAWCRDAQSKAESNAAAAFLPNKIILQEEHFFTVPEAFRCRANGNKIVKVEETRRFYRVFMRKRASFVSHRWPRSQGKPTAPTLESKNLCFKKLESLLLNRKAWWYGPYIQESRQFCLEKEGVEQFLHISWFACCVRCTVQETRSKSAGLCWGL